MRGQTLYTTTFPCHNCAKHIIESGIQTVLYIEPYPKSEAKRLHGDATSMDSEDPPRVAFLPFRGVAPRMYPLLFSSLTPHGQRLKRKDEVGKAIEPGPNLRIAAYPLNYIDREGIVALELAEQFPKE